MVAGPQPWVTDGAFAVPTAVGAGAVDDVAIPDVGVAAVAVDDAGGAPLGVNILPKNDPTPDKP